MLDKKIKEEIKKIYQNFKWTPVMEQWKKIKENSVKKYGEKTIIFFQLGTFFESYFEDAYITSNLIGQTLTSKNKKDPFAAPMSGSPISVGLKKATELVKKGYNVIIVEEIGIAGSKNFKREITQILTPGTFNEIEGKENNFVYSILKKVNGYSISLIDSNSNIFYGVEIGENNFNFLLNLLQIYLPKEILVDKNIDKSLFKGVITNFIIIDDIISRKEKIPQNIIKKIGNFPVLLDSVSILLGYIEEIYQKKLSYIEDIEVLNPKNYFFLNKTTIKNLEILKNSEGYIENSLLDSIRNTFTAMGTRSLKNIIVKPLIKKEIIEERLNTVECLFKNEEKVKKIISKLLKINDIERLASKLISNKIKPQEIINLKNSLKEVEEIKEVLKELNGKTQIINLIIKNLNNFENEINLIEKILKEKGSNNPKEGNIIKEGLDKELDELILKTSKKEIWYQKYEEELKEKYKINLKVKENNLGAYIEIKKDEKIPENQELKKIKMLKDADRYETKELLDFYRKSLEAAFKRKNLEYKIFTDLRLELSKSISKIQKTSKKIGMLDVFISFYIQASTNNYIKPKIVNEKIIDIKKGRHPVIEKIVPFVKNNTYMKEKNFHIITGPNMGGKSTYIRQVALIVLLAQIGSYIPSNKNSTIGIVNGIFTRIGASDSLKDGESTFYIEAKETAEIINNSNEKSLIILDELGRGTSFEDGESLSKSIIDYITKKDIRTFFSTHLHNLNILEKENKKIENYHFGASFDEKNNIKFNHQIKKGGTNQSYGLEIAELAGIPKKIIEKAKLYKKQKV